MAACPKQPLGKAAMKLARRKLLHLAAGTAAGRRREMVADHQEIGDQGGVKQSWNSVA
jgi:hypothetical protein